MDLGVTAEELQNAPQSYVEDLPGDVVKVVASSKELADDHKGRLAPYGVIGGVVFAMVTRASY